MTTATQPQRHELPRRHRTRARHRRRLGLVHMDKPAGEMPPLHVHHNEDEGFYVLGGELTLYLPGESVTLRAGDFFLAPRGVPHAYEVGARRRAHARVERPVGLRALRDRGRASSTSVSPEILERRVAAEHGIEILGPPGARPRSQRAPGSSSSALRARRSSPRPAPRSAPPR